MPWRRAAYLAGLWHRFIGLLTARAATGEGLQDKLRSILSAREEINHAEARRAGVRSAAVSFAKLPRLTLSQVQHHLGLAEHGFARPRPIFISIDFEYSSATLRASEMGLAVFDSHLYQPENDSNNKISFFHYNVKSSTTCFAFGNVKHVALSEAGSVLDDILQESARMRREDVASSLQHVKRDIILVGHGLKADYLVAWQLGAKLPGVTGYFDTSRTKEVLRDQDSPRLVALLEVLGIRDMKRAATLHNAGNDAAFTLLAMIALARQELRDPGGVVHNLIEHRRLYPKGDSQGQWLPSRQPVNLPLREMTPYPQPRVPKRMTSAALLELIEQRKQAADALREQEKAAQQEPLSLLLLQAQQRKQAVVSSAKKIMAKQAADLAQLAIPRSADHLRPALLAT